jgi:hypothetical protein
MRIYHNYDSLWHFVEYLDSIKNKEKTNTDISSDEAGQGNVHLLLLLDLGGENLRDRVKERSRQREPSRQDN